MGCGSSNKASTSAPEPTPAPTEPAKPAEPQPEPAAPEEPAPAAEAAEPAATEPAATEPAVAEPAGSDDASPEPAAPDTAPEPAAEAAPEVAPEAAADPEPAPGTEPTAPEEPAPAAEACEPAAAEPAAAEPAAAEPAAAEPSEPVSSEEYSQFHAAFSKYHDLAAGKEARKVAWTKLDNGNGIVSYAEFSKWIKAELVDACGDEVKGEALYTAFEPSYQLSFEDARDVSDKSKSKEGFIEYREFRVSTNFLTIYAKMLEAFAVLDKGASNSPMDDRKVDTTEWEAGYSKLSNFGFAAFQDGEGKATEAFKAIDTDGSGVVMLRDFCRYVEKAEKEAGTDVGKLLAIGEEDD